MKICFLIIHCSILGLCASRGKSHGMSVVFNFLTLFSWKRGKCLSWRDSWQVWYVTLHLGGGIVIKPCLIINSSYDLSKDLFPVRQKHCSDKWSWLFRYNNLTLYISLVYALSKINYFRHYLISWIVTMNNYSKNMSI